MKTQRIRALTGKELKKTIREPAALFMIFLFPIMFVLAFGASFGGVGTEQVSYHVGVVNMDQTNAGVPHSQLFLNTLTDTQILNLQTYTDKQTAQMDLSQGKIQALIVIPAEFTQSVTSYQTAPNNPNEWINITVSLYLDKGSISATQAISPIIQQALSVITDQAQQAPATPLSIETASIVEVEQTSALDFIAPGMFTFASIFLIMMVAQSFAQDRENGMMKRIRVTPVTSTEFITSQTLAYLSIALIQAALIFAMTYALGFQPNVGIPAYAFAFVLVTVFSLSNIGFGLITATVAKSSNAATGISFLFVLPQLFVGTFVGASLSEAAQVAGKFVPSYYVTDTLTTVFLRGAPLSSPTILFNFAIVSGSCIAILAAGIIVYNKYYKS